LNVFSFYKVRTIYQEKLVDFNSSNSSFTDNRWGLNFLARYGVGYNFSENWGGLVQVGYQKSLTNWSREANIKMTPKINNIL
jgi:hypothetical protein